MKNISPVIGIDHLTIGYRKDGRRLPVLNNINVELKKGEMVCLVGENGIGKSTLLRTICGVQPTLDGRIMIYNKPLHRYSALELARSISLVLTDPVFAGNLRVEELVSLGRHPYTNWLGDLTKTDKEKIEWSMSIAGVTELRNHLIGEISDGQFQKVLIARALAQDGDIIILDEPTAHLDLTNKISILKLLKDLSVQTGKSILMATHELEFSFQIADRIWIALKNEPLISGVPEDLMLDMTFEKLIRHEAIDFDMSNGRFSVKTQSRWKCNLEGPRIARFWTTNALERNYWEISKEKQPVRIHIHKNNDGYQWELNIDDRSDTYTRIEPLIHNLKQYTRS